MALSKLKNYIVKVQPIWAVLTPKLTLAVALKLARAIAVALKVSESPSLFLMLS